MCIKLRELHHQRTGGKNEKHLVIAIVNKSLFFLFCFNARPFRKRLFLSGGRDFKIKPTLLNKTQ